MKMKYADRGVDESETLARPAGAVSDALALAGRGLRTLRREPESALTALLVPLCLFAIEVGALGNVARDALGIEDYKAFQLPVAMLFAATWSSAGVGVIMDMTTGYWDKLCLTPARRGALVVGRLLGELIAVMGYGIVLLGFGWAIGIRFAGSEVSGGLTLIFMTLLFGAGYDAILLTFAMTTGSLRATQTASFVVFFPLLFLTPWLLPRHAMTDWMSIVVSVNPVTYMLEGARALVLGGSNTVVVRGVLATLGFATFFCVLAVVAFERRMRKAS